MISKCDSVVLRHKKFSDFDIFDPLLNDGNNQIYVAGYIEEADGERRNIKIPSSLFFKTAKDNGVIGTLDTAEKYEDIFYRKEEYNDQVIKVWYIKYNIYDFLQINNINESAFSNIDGKKYLCIKLDSDVPVGFVYRFYFPNFQFDRGLLLFPTTKADVAHDTPIEVFFNKKEDDDDTRDANDFYTHLIQLGDPKIIGSEAITTRTKVIGVLNIESD